MESERSTALALGINEKTVHKWCKQDEYIEYEHSLCRERFKDAQKIALETMVKAAEKGNIKAAQYFLDNTGYVLPTEQNVNLTGNMEINITDKE